MREKLADVTGRPGTARGTGPAQTVGKVLQRRFAADSVFHNIGRQAHSDMIGRQTAQHKIFRQVIFHSLDTAQCVKGAATRNNGRANREFGCAFHHGGREQAGMKIGIHPDGFEL
jgi:hypothetical protein